MRTGIRWLVIGWEASIYGDDQCDYCPPVTALGWTSEQALRRVREKAERRFRPRREVRL